ncbi:hypothetical protein OZ10_09720, partial [Xanthomonas cannabis pv. cannabis]
DRDGIALPFRMRGYPALTVLALVILAVLFVLLASSPDTRAQFLSMVALTAGIAVVSELARRMRRQR